MTILYVTYCAAAKDPTPGPLAAARRYRSTRIDAVGAWAVRRGAAFRILSGKYGLLAPDEPIPDYDHLLTADQVAAHIQHVAGQLRGLGPSDVVFYTRRADADPGAMPYRRCCVEACGLVGVACKVIEVPDGPVDTMGRDPDGQE